MFGMRVLAYAENRHCNKVSPDIPMATVLDLTVAVPGGT